MGNYRRVKLTKTATVPYTPMKGDVTDTITASYKGKNLISKEFYISPDFECIITPDDSFYMDEQNHFYISIKPLGVEDSIIISRYDIIDNHEVEVSYAVRRAVPSVFEAYCTPTKDYLNTGISFTVKILYKEVTYTWTSQVYPVLTDEGAYDLNIKEGKLEYGTEAHVQVLTDSTMIPTGSSILFESTYGLNAEGKMED